MNLDSQKMLLCMAGACLTISELSAQSGLSRPALTKYAAGKANPKPATIGKIARALNVPVTEIIENAAATANEKN